MSRKSRLKTYERNLKVLVEEINSRPPDVQNKLMWQWLFVKITFGILLATPLIYFLLSYIGGVLLQQSILASPLFKGVAFVALCTLAGLLFALKERLRYVYGALEIAFSLAVIAQAVTQVESQGIAAWTAAGAAVYVLVRALENLVVGYRNPPPLKVRDNG